MNPFDLPPAGARVPMDAPEPSADPGPHRPPRGRTALVAIVTLGLVGGGIAGVSQFASADRPDLAVTAPDEPTDETIAPVDDDSDDDGPTRDEPGRPAEDPAAPEPTDAEPTEDGQIVLDTGDGDPIVIDLDDLDMGRIGGLTECIGLPSFDFDGGFGEFTPGDPAAGELPLDLEELLGDLPFDLEALDDLEQDWPADLGGLGEFGVDGGSVTVVGPDGVSIVDLGENGSVTVTSDDGEVSVSTEGDATVSELDDLLGDLGSIFERGPGTFEDEHLDDLPGLEPIDPDAVQSCIDEMLGN